MGVGALPPLQLTPDQHTARCPGDPAQGWTIAGAFAKTKPTMTTDKAPDFAGIAQALASKRYPSEQMPDFDGEVSYGPSWRNAYAFCMEARLQSDWETIRLLRNVKLIMHRAGHVDGCPMASLWDPSPCNCGLDAAFIEINERLSKLLEPFTP